MLHRSKPANQAAFHKWVGGIFRRVFRGETRPEGLMLPVDTAPVKGLTVYGAKCGETTFYGAWMARLGVFVGWMRIQPQIAGIGSNYAVGDVLGRPVFVGISLDLSGHNALDKFTMALNEAAGDLGVDGRGGSRRRAGNGTVVSGL